jgi:transcription antitermination factor NusG
MDKKWYAVYTKPRWEKKVADTLEHHNITNYCPLNKVVRQWSDRKKTVHVPLFTSYVFVHITDKQFGELKKIDGILNFVYWLGRPAQIKDEEIDIIKRFLNEHTNVQLEKTEVAVNDTVKVVQGSLLDREGTIVEIKNKLIKVALPSLGYIMYAELDKLSVVKVADKLHS